MRFLLLSLGLLGLSCASYPKKSGLGAAETLQTTVHNPYFSDPATDYVYNAEIRFGAHSFSGLFIVKKTGPLAHRVVCTTKGGQKIFDFLLEDGKVTVKQMLPQMDRKMVVGLLGDDFRTLVMETRPVNTRYIGAGDTVYGDQTEKVRYFYRRDAQGLREIIRWKRGKARTQVVFSKREGDRAEAIAITHAGLPLTIDLNRL